MISAPHARNAVFHSLSALWRNFGLLCVDSACWQWLCTSFALKAAWR